MDEFTLSDLEAILLCAPLRSRMKAIRPRWLQAGMPKAARKLGEEAVEIHCRCAGSDTEPN
jgi:phosphoribosyl-ATP pyrophosphohydrolase